jgi:hypothetical protein
MGDKVNLEFSQVDIQINKLTYFAVSYIFFFWRWAISMKIDHNMFLRRDVHSRVSYNIKKK